MTAAEAAAALASSDIEKNSRLCFDEIGEGEGEGEGEGTCLSFFPFSLAEMRCSFLLKDSSVGNFHGTRYI